MLGQGSEIRKYWLPTVAIKERKGRANPSATSQCGLVMSRGPVQLSLGLGLSRRDTTASNLPPPVSQRVVFCHGQPSPADTLCWSVLHAHAMAPAEHLLEGSCRLLVHLGLREVAAIDAPLQRVARRGVCRLGVRVCLAVGIRRVLLLAAPSASARAVRFWQRRPRCWPQRRRLLPRRRTGPLRVGGGLGPTGKVVGGSTWQESAQGKTEMEGDGSCTSTIG